MSEKDTAIAVIAAIVSAALILLAVGLIITARSMAGPPSDPLNTWLTCQNNQTQTWQPWVNPTPADTCGPMPTGQ